MSIKNKLLINFSIVIILLACVGIKSNAALIEETWKDPQSNFTFKISVDENGNIDANLEDDTVGKVSIDDLKTSDDFKKKRAQDVFIGLAKKRALDYAKNKYGGNVTKDSDSTEEQQEITETSTVSNEIFKLLEKTLNSLTKAGIAGGNNIICVDHDGKLAESPEKNVIIVGNNRITVTDSISMKNMKIKTGTSTTFRGRREIIAKATQPSQGMVTTDTKYSKGELMTLGETYDSAAIAYAFSRVNNNIDNASGKLENYLQVATWIIDYFKKRRKI